MKQNHANLNVKSFNTQKRQKYVAELFDDLATKYDRFNRWVSFFRDEAWRRQTVALLKKRASGIILDLAAGTGDLARSALDAGAREVHVFDISYEMLTIAKAKLVSQKGEVKKIVFEQGSANLLPFQNQSLDGIVSGFAMRNVFHFLEEVLAEMHRVLKPGGRFAILELSTPSNWFLRLGFRLHLKTIMPLIGVLITGKSEPFKYLYQTTMTFLSPIEFVKKLEKAGFVEIHFKTFLTGGIAIHHGLKPSDM